MKNATWSDQYNRRCVVCFDGDNADSLMKHCKEIGAVYFDGESELYVIELRPDVGPKLWSESALRRTKFQMPINSLGK